MYTQFINQLSDWWLPKFIFKYIPNFNVLILKIYLAVKYCKYVVIFTYFSDNRDVIFNVYNLHRESIDVLM